MKGKFPNGLSSVLKHVTISKSELARKLNTSRQNIQRWVDGERRLTPATAGQIAPILKCSVQDLLLIADDGMPEVAIEGSVGAGGSIIDIDADTSGLETVSVVAGEPRAAVRISGDSLGRFEGWVAILGDRAAFSDSLVGSLCVVETRSGEFLIKWLVKSKGSGLTLVSGDGSTHSEDAKIEWAAPVLGLRPPRAP